MPVLPLYITSIKMFNFFNSSIFNRSLPQDHDCLKENCSGNALFGLNKTCRLCKNVSFYQCISKRPEVECVLKGIIPDDFDGQSQTRLAEIQKKLDILFGNESVFQFICPSCLLSEILESVNLPHNEIMNKQKKDITKLKTALTKSSNESERLKVQMQELQSALDDSTQNENNDKCNKCDRLNAEIARLIQEIENLKVKISDRDSVNGFDPSTAFNAIAMYSVEIRDSLAQIDKNKSDIASHLDSINMSIPDEFLNGVNLVSAKSSTGGQVNNLNPNSTDFKAKKDVNGYFNAPKKLNKVNESNNSAADPVRSIYVGPFDTHIECSDICDHILSSTEIENKNFFAVKKLIRANDNIKRKTFIAFKILTFSADVYETILNKELWGPNQTARPFDSQSRSQKMNPFDRDYRRSQYWRENDFPRNMNNNFPRKNMKHRNNQFGGYRLNRDSQFPNRDNSYDRPFNRPYNRPYNVPPRFQKNWQDDSYSGNRQPPQRSYDNRQPANNNNNGNNNNSNNNNGYTRQQRDNRIHSNSDQLNFLDANNYTYGQQFRRFGGNSGDYQYRSTQSINRI